MLRAFSFWRSIPSGSRQRPDGGERRWWRPLRTRLAVEALEDRTVPSVFVVTNLADGGDGSLRQATLTANASPGPDERGPTAPRGGPAGPPGPPASGASPTG